MVGTRTSSRLRGQQQPSAARQSLELEQQQDEQIAADSVAEGSSDAEGGGSAGDDQSSDERSPEAGSEDEAALDALVELAVKAGNSNSAAVHPRKRVQLRVRSLDSGLPDAAYISYTADGQGQGAHLVSSASNSASQASQAAQGGKAAGGTSDLYNDTPGSVVAPLNKVREVRVGGKTAGKGWFDMRGGEVTAELKRDIALVRMRGYLDPKRFYKAPEVGLRGPELVQLGTVVEGPTEYHTARLAKKQRRATIADELLADAQIKQYAKNMHKKISDQRQGRKRNPRQQFLAFGAKRKPKR